MADRQGEPQYCSVVRQVANQTLTRVDKQAVNFDEAMMRIDHLSAPSSFD
jgi:hypothetical protein